MADNLERNSNGGEPDTAPAIVLSAQDVPGAGIAGTPEPSLCLGVSPAFPACTDDGTNCSVAATPSARTGNP